ncbi:hypothetical protein GBAR_LOCUS27222 [Geodia barretti]|uniref:Uncharacterized protein n=1 Tax=Geodia barretti TaxID=519541 RepID=A0AA35XEJ2_GEOBA|nr:hypothetical protein GBAR_LOCUS27222 [Geodia barretti]
MSSYTDSRRSVRYTIDTIQLLISFPLLLSSTRLLLSRVDISILLPPPSYIFFVRPALLAGLSVRRKTSPTQKISTSKPGLSLSTCSTQHYINKCGKFCRGLKSCNCVFVTFAIGNYF